MASETSRKLKLLFTGGGGSVTQSLYAQWSVRYDIWFADAEPRSIPSVIPEERRLAVPYASESTFAAKILEHCKEHGIDVLVPTVDEELPILSACKNTPGWPEVLVPEIEFVDLMLDKLDCASAIHEFGLSAPKTLPLDRAAEIGFPLIAKPRKGRGSRGVMRLANENEVEAYFVLQGGTQDTYIAQELIEGTEYTVLVAADGSSIPRAVIPVLAFEKRGVTIRAQTDSNQDVINYAKEFQDKFRATGCYNIQCMLTPDGQVYPFEVNPRISTTFVLAIATGFDPIALIFSERTKSVFVPKRQMMLQRSWYSHIEPSVS